MNYGQIMIADSANGLGMRVSLFVSGCLNHCKGCFQPETWDLIMDTPLPLKWNSSLWMSSPTLTMTV